MSKNKKKNINHNPQVESTKASFGEPKKKDEAFLPRTFK